MVTIVAAMAVTMAWKLQHFLVAGETSWTDQQRHVQTDNNDDQSSSSSGVYSLRPTAIQSDIVGHAVSTETTGDEDDSLLVQYGDSIYTRNNWDGAPIVIPQYKLIFFTTAKVGCTVWKQLFRRIMGEADWNQQNTGQLLPWNPEVNGLRYLYDYNRTEASRLLTDPTWVRAVIVRDPKTRFLSAWLDKVRGNPDYTNRACCPTRRQCVHHNTTLAEFLPLARTCDNAHWMPQARRMEAKYWETINFVGHMETIAHDAEQLLRRVGAWEDYGQSGWGPTGNASMFAATEHDSTGRQHATHAVEKLRLYYTPELEQLVDEFYAEDYQNPILGLSRTTIFPSD